MEIGTKSSTLLMGFVWENTHQESLIGGHITRTMNNAVISSIKSYFFIQTMHSGCGIYNPCALLMFLSFVQLPQR